MSQSYRLKLERASLKLRVASRIPAQLDGGTGIDVTRANGTYTIGLDFSELGEIAAYDAALEATTYLASWESSSDTFSRQSITNIKADFATTFGGLYQPLDADLTALALTSTDGQLAVGQTSAHPLWKTITGDLTFTAAGATAIGATKVTNAMLNADVFSNAHTWSADQTLTLNQNAVTKWVVNNNSAGISAVALFNASNGTDQASFGIGGTGYTGQSSNLLNRAFIYAGPLLNGIAIWADGADPTNFYNNGSLSGGFSSAGIFSLVTPLALTSGGVGASTQAGARTTLGLVPGTDVQAFDADLAALAANSTDGLWAHTGAGTGSARTLAAPAAGITITNPAGIAGNPTFALANDLAALEALSSTGILVRTASETYAQRTVTAPAAGITVSNGDGVSGNPTLALANDLSAVEGLSSTGIARRTGTDAWSVGTAVANSEMATMAAYTFKGNNTGSTAVPTDVDIAGLTTKASPAAGDYIMLSDQAASGAWKKATVSSVSAAGSVSSIAGNTGAFTLSNGITNSTNDIRLNVSGLTEDTAPDVAADFLVTYDNSASSHKKVKPVNLSQGFAAHKNGTDQTGIASVTFTKITFTTEAFDVGSYYDAANSKWTPPAGIVLICAGVALTNITATAVTYVILYKNGSRFRDAISTPGSGSTGNTIAVIDQANGTDYYEIYVYGNTASTITSPGNPSSNTYFSGKVM